MIWTRGRATAFAVVVGGLFAVEVGRTVIRAAGAADPAPVQSPGKYLGASTCDGASCHGKAEARPTPPYLTEYTSWSAVNQETNLPYDRHSYAFKRLKPKDKGGDERSPAIMAKLNAIEKTNDTAETSERCLTCHGVSVHDYGVGAKNPGAAVGKHKELQGAKYRADDGVSCDGCHGPAEKWIKKHDKKDWAISEWKKLGGEKGGSQKLYDETGIYYSKDLQLWANQCIRCHLKIDTNLLDAGHPDLVAFELFGQSQQVPHWRDYTTATPSPELPAAGPMHPSVVWQTGQVAALKDAFDQIAVRSKGDAINRVDPAHVKNSLERAIGHWTVVRHALERVAPDVHKTLVEDSKALAELAKAEKLDLEKLAALAKKMSDAAAPLARTAADHKNDLAHVTATMKGIANDADVLASPRAAEQAMKALYALNYARLAQTKPDALAANPPEEPVMKAVYAMFESPDPTTPGFKSALEAVRAALK